MNTPAKYLVITMLLFPLSLAAQVPTGDIAGTVVEAGSFAPLPGINVVIDGTTTGAATDAEGRYRIEGVAVGTYTLRFSAIGFETAHVADVVVRSRRTTQVDRALGEQVLEGEEVVVMGGTFFEASSASMTSVQTMRYEEIRRAAGAVGDVLRLAQAMPGVALTDDQRNDLVVRGGSPSENLTLIDNVEVPSLNHFGAQNTSGGPISMLNTEFISEADFLAGGFSAQYGDRLSSVLDISFREGNRQRYAGDMEMGIAGFGMIAEGPIRNKGSFIISARRSYLNLLQDAIGLTAVPNYWNFNSKFVYEPSQRDRLWLVSLTGIDDITFEVDPDDLDDPSLDNSDFNGWQTINGVNWRRLFGARGYGVLGVSDAIYSYSSLVRDEGEDNQVVFRERDVVGTTTAKYDLTLLPGVVDELRAGVQARLYRTSFDLEQPLGAQVPFVPSIWTSGRLPCTVPLTPKSRSN